MSPPRRHRVAVLVLPGVLPLAFGGRPRSTSPATLTTTWRWARARTVPLGVHDQDHGRPRRARTRRDGDRPGVRGRRCRCDDGCARRTTHGTTRKASASYRSAWGFRARLGWRPQRTSSATTHWRWADELQRRFPEIEVLPNRLFVDDGDLLTSAGVTTGIDLCLHLIRRDHDEATATPAPDTWSHHHSAMADKPSTSSDWCRCRENGNELDSLREWMREDLALPLDLDMLARHAHMSRRHSHAGFTRSSGSGSYGVAH